MENFLAPSFRPVPRNPGLPLRVSGNPGRWSRDSKSGVAAGGAISWDEGFALNASGNVGIEKSLVLGEGTTTKQSSGGPELISFQHSAFNHVAFACFVGDDDHFQFGASMHGFMEWGPGTADQDVALFRHGAGGGLVVQSFNNTTSGHAFAVRRPTTGADGADLFRVSTASDTVLAFGNVGIGESSPDYKLDVNGAIGFTLGSSLNPVDNGDVVIEFTDSTHLTFKAKSGGVVRSATITLS